MTFCSSGRPPNEPAPASDKATSQRVIKELDPREPHSLTEDFCYKRPYGFVINGWAVKDVTTWRRMYEVICHHLAAKDAKRFAQLPSNPDFISNRGNPDFAATPDVLRAPAEMAKGVYAEVNLSANGIRDRIAKLLKAFGYDPTEMKVYLREDRDADAAIPE